jgi:hypothetical protein
MKFFLFLYLNFTFFSLAFGADSRWQGLMKLINQEMKLLERAKNKNVEIKYRMLELHSEKLKLIHEKNNNEFLEGKRKSQRGKDDFFKETRSYYKMTKEFGLKILHEEIKNKRKAEILFALGLNSRDYGQDNIIEKYLLEVISLSHENNQSLRHHAETALADFYYNEKKYPLAIQFYQKVIKNFNDDWMTKHLFNLSWCLLKNHQFYEAIEHMKLAYIKSKNASYIDIRDQVLENIGTFYVYAGRALEGLDFYEKNEKNPILFLISLAQKTSEKGHEKETKVILDSAQNIINHQKLLKHQEVLLHAYLDFYRHYSKFSDFEKTTKLMVEYYIQASSQKDKKNEMVLKNDAIEKIQSLVGFLQVKISKNIKKMDIDFNHNELQIILNIFSHLKKLNPLKKSEYLYFEGETLFSVSKIEEAAKIYVASILEAKRLSNLDIAKKSMDSLLGLTAKDELPREINKHFLIFSYSEHISIWPIDQRSLQIYPKLFEIYLEDKNDQKATDLIMSFHKYYPDHLKDQQISMTKVLDQYIECKNTDKLNYWIGEFKKGFLGFTKENIEKTEMILGHLLFNKYQNLAKNGDKKGAAQGFEELYDNKIYPVKIRSEAAYFASVSHLELSETKKFFDWQLLSLDLMTQNKDKLINRQEQLMFNEKLFKLQDFETAHRYSSFLLDYFCSLKDKIQTRFFEISIMTALVLEKNPEAESIVKRFSQCLNQPEAREAALSQIYHSYEKKALFFDLRLFVKRHSSFRNQYRHTLIKWYWDKSNHDLKDRIKIEFLEMNHPESNEWMRDWNEFKKMELTSIEIQNNHLWNGSAFQMDKFNSSLDSFLLRLKSFKDRYHHLTQCTQTELAIRSTLLMADTYRTAGEIIQSVNPPGVEEKMKNDFNLAMNSMSGRILSISSDYKKALSKALIDKEVMSSGSRIFAGTDDVENPVFSFYSSLIMDRTKD